MAPEEAVEAAEAAEAAEVGSREARFLEFLERYSPLKNGVEILSATSLLFPFFLAEPFGHAFEPFGSSANVRQKTFSL